MNTPIYFFGRNIGTIPYSSVTAFLMFCEQIGCEAQWNADTRSILFDFRARKKVVVSCGGNTNDSHSMTAEILNNITDFVSDHGVDTVFLTDQKSHESDGDLYLILTLTQFPFINCPIVYTNHNLGICEYWVTNFLEKHLCNNQVKFVFNKSPHNPGSLPFLYAGCVMPEVSSHSVSKQYIEEISMILALCILQTLQTDTQNTIIAFMLQSMLKEFMHELPKTEENRIKHFEKEALETTQTEHTQAEVYFDYSTVTQLDNDRRLIIANLNIKNTGTANLYNPIIYIRLTPAKSMKLRGQILPPAMAKSHGVQDSAGSKGWQYMNDDWLDIGTLKGEYWISPIRPMNIPPQGIEVLNNLQIVIDEPQETNIVTVEGIVFCREQGLQFPAYNRIIVRV